MNRKERRANKKKNRNAEAYATENEVGSSQAEFNRWVRNASYSDVFWKFAETQMIESFERANPGKRIEASIERRIHDGFYFPFVEGLNPEDVIGHKIEGDLTKKWIFIALLTHVHVGAFSFEKDIKNHEREAIANMKAIRSYTKF